MFSKSQVEAVTGEQVTLSNNMIQHLQEWENMLEGKARWVDQTDDDGVKSLRLENSICREFANVTLSEMETKLNNQTLNPMYQKAIKNLNENFQDGLGLGSFVIKPIGMTNMYEYIPATRIVPLEYSADNKLVRCAFVQVKPIGDNDVYYRLEIHELLPEGLRITNKAFKGTAGSFGTEIPLTYIGEWADLLPEVLYQGMNRVDFGYYKNPLPNKIDGSMNGVSIFNMAVEKIRKADIQFGRIDWEYSSGERLVFADYSSVKKQKDIHGDYHWRAPKGKERMFVATDIDEQWEDHSPTLRDGNYIAGLNEYKRAIEFDVSLAYGDLSKNETVEKTAQEIMSAKDRKYNMVNAIQSNLKDCLEDLAYAIAFYQAQFTTDIGFECNFHDSIKTDEETERAQDRMDMQLGILSKIEYRMKWYNEDEKTAMTKIEEVSAELATGNEGNMS